MTSNARERVKVCLYLKPTKYATTFNPRPESRDFDVSRGINPLKKEIIDIFSPAEERVKTILENLNILGKVILSIQTISAKETKDPYVVVIDQISGKERTMSITKNLTEEQLTDFINGLERRPLADGDRIWKLKLDGATPIDLTDFTCANCGNHQFKIFPDYSGCCVKCGKSYREIKIDA
ncbi:MAG: hypothetical protein V1934_00515 [Methanobacteriota archaeon]